MNKSQTFALSFCGFLALATAMGFSRFAYTAFLPLMMDDHRGISLGLWSILGSSHHLGYLAGLLLTAVLPRALACIPAIFAANAVNSLLMLTFAFGDAYSTWVGSRTLAGLLSGFVFMLTTRLIAYEVRMIDPRQLAIVYAGVGAGIAVSALLCYISPSAEQGWALLAITGFTLSMSCMVLYTRAFKRSSTAPSPQRANATVQLPLHHARFVLVFLFIAYAIEGFSYIITSTFVVASIQKAMHLDASGAALFWLVFGLFCAPSTLLWGAVQKRAGTLATLACGYVLQAIGTAMASSSQLWSLLAACVLLGATFMGITSITLSAVAELTESAQKLAFWITLVYSLGQFLGPLWISVYVGTLADMRGAYETIAALILFAGLLPVCSRYLVNRKHPQEGIVDAVRQYQDNR